MNLWTIRFGIFRCGTKNAPFIFEQVGYLGIFHISCRFVSEWSVPPPCGSGEWALHNVVNMTQQWLKFRNCDIDPSDHCYFVIPFSNNFVHRCDLRRNWLLFRLQSIIHRASSKSPFSPDFRHPLWNAVVLRVVLRVVSCLRGRVVNVVELVPTLSLEFWKFGHKRACCFIVHESYYSQ